MSGITVGPLYKTFIRTHSLPLDGHYCKAVKMGRAVAVIRCPDCDGLFYIDAKYIEEDGCPTGAVSCGHCDFKADIRLLGWGQ